VATLQAAQPKTGALIPAGYCRCHPCSTASGVKLKSMWSYTSAPPACLHVAHLCTESNDKIISKYWLRNHVKNGRGFILDSVPAFAHRTWGKPQKESKQPISRLRSWIQSCSIVCPVAVCCQTEDIALQLNKMQSVPRSKHSPSRLQKPVS